MSQAPCFHLAVMQPPGYIHSLGFLDPARYVRYQLRRLGMEVSIGKNRLREDAVNLVFGAHLGFNPALRERYAYLICNLEQIDPGGAHLSEEYLRLLKSSAVVDYEAQNVLHYCEDVQNVPLLSFYSAPYLKAENLLALEDRPIDHDVPADEDILFSFEDEPDESAAGITEPPHEMVLKHAVAPPLPGVNGRSRFCRGSSQCPATP